MIKKLIAVVITTIGIILASAGLASAHDYTVEPGDTLSDIADEWEVPGGWQALYEWNDGEIEDPNLIFPGQTLTIEEHKFIGDGKSKSKSEPRQKPKRSKSEPKKKQASGGNGDKVRPATGPITSNYLGGYRKNGGHSGTDFAGSDGNAYAAAAGTVKAAFWDGAYGNKVVIAHGGGVQTWYAHLASFSVSVDDRVSAGQKVGNIGETGNTTGPHLHFEVRINGEMTDPLGWLD